MYQVKNIQNTDLMKKITHFLLLQNFANSTYFGLHIYQNHLLYRRNALFAFIPAFLIHPLVSIPLTWGIKQIDIFLGKLVFRFTKSDYCKQLWKRTASAILLFIFQIFVISMLYYIDANTDVFVEKNFNPNKLFNQCIQNKNVSILGSSLFLLLSIKVSKLYSILIS